MVTGVSIHLHHHGARNGEFADPPNFPCGSSDFPGSRWEAMRRDM